MTDTIEDPTTFGKGVNIRSMERTLKADPSITMLEMSFWPLPKGIPAELAEFLSQKASEFLQARDITNGEMTDLTAQGLPQ